MGLRRRVAQGRAGPCRRAAETHLGIWGKILGGTAGLVLGGPIGALVGAVAGHAYDKSREFTDPRLEGGADPFAGAETRRVAFATAVVVLGAKLAKADGVVTRAEIQAFRDTFGISDDEVGDVSALWDQARERADGFEPYARQIAVLFGRSPELLEELLHGLFVIAAADGEINHDELRFLGQVAHIFGFDPTSFARLHALFEAAQRVGGPRVRFEGARGRASRRPEPAVDPYAVLGLTGRAGDEEVRAAWKRLVREHHPDRLTAQGLPEEFVAQANRTLGAINAAYDQIAKQRGLR